MTLVLTVGAIWLTIRGVKLSTTAVGVAVLVQVAIMTMVCVLVLVDQRAQLSGIPFSWAHLTGGLVGLSTAAGPGSCRPSSVTSAHHPTRR